MELQSSQDSEHGNVGLPRTHGSTNQEVLVSVVGLVVHYGLNQIEGFCPLKGRPGHFVETRNLDFFNSNIRHGGVAGLCR